jgi:hypothetical protein
VQGLLALLLLLLLQRRLLLRCIASYCTATVL